MGRINLLPHWHLTNPQPAFYDLESATAVDMVAKVYGAMRELQSDYNNCVDEINKTIKEFISSTEKNQECFMNKITKIGERGKEIRTLSPLVNLHLYFVEK